MPECECGAHVSPEFVRVFSDNHGNIHACPECSDMVEILNGAGADPDHEPRVNQRYGISRRSKS